MDCCCIDVDDPCEVTTRKRRRACMVHWCCECHRLIPLGAHYWHESALYDGSWSAYATCELCMHVRDDLMQCGWRWGDLWLDLAECLGGNDGGWLDPPTAAIEVT